MSIIDIPVEAEPIAEPFEVPEYDEYEKAALKYINKMRGILGSGPIESLPRGNPGGPSSCVVAQGIRQGGDSDISQYASGTYLFIENAAPGERLITLGFPDKRTVQFIRAFDNGAYPQHRLLR